MSAFISFENVKKTYHMGEIDIHALDDVSFEIQQGEFVISQEPVVLVKVLS